MAVDLQAFGEHRRNLELEHDVIFGFVAPERQERRLAAPLWPVQMLLEAHGGQVLHAQPKVKEKIDRKGRLQVDEGPPRRRHTTSRCVPEPIRKLI